jgi:hypothetical protein
MLTYIDLFPKSEKLIEEQRDKRLGDQPYIHPSAVVYDSHIGSWTEIGPHCQIIASTFDDYSYVADNVSMIYTTVGKYASIASHVRINPGNHPMQRVTQHHMTYRRKQYGFGEDDTAFFDWRRAAHCTIGHDVWLGHAVTVMPGVSIGHGAVLGAGAVVTHDIPPYMIAVGVPAKPLRLRFPEQTVEKLLQIAWWDWDRATLELRFGDLFDLPTFIEKYG